MIFNKSFSGEAIADGNGKVIKPAQVLPAKLSHLLTDVPLLALIFTCCMFGELLIVVQFEDTGLMGNLLRIIYAFFRE